MDDPSILVEADGSGVAMITLNRPTRLNAMSAEMGRDLITALDRLDQASVRAIVITGSGRAFCAGADLSGGADAFAPTPRSADIPRRDWGGVLALRLFAMDRPVIVAVNGDAVGVGATLTLPCDVRLASTTARFGFVFARRGIVTDGCASWFLPRVVGPSAALRWCLTGRLVSADEALGEGLVASLHEPTALLDAARAIATEIAATTSPVSVAVTRHLLWRGMELNHPIQSHVYETELLAKLAPSEDAREGVSAFLEKRPPRFPGTVPGSMPEGWPPWDEPTYEETHDSLIS
jgi:enoyl-CoA hydratase/carnithine racemase